MLAATAVLFHYEYNFLERKEQNTVISMVDPALNIELFEMIDRRDPVHTYGVYRGGFSSLLGEHKYDIDLRQETLPPVPEYPKQVAGSALPEETAFPVSIRYAAVLPEKTAGIALHPQIVTPEGKTSALKIPAGLQGSPVRDSVLKISGGPILSRCEVLRSCGDRRLDEQAGNILKSTGAAPGIYLINWAGVRSKP